MALTVLNGALSWDATINTSGFEAQIRRLENQIQNLTNTTNSEADAIQNIVRSTTTALATYASFTGAKELISNIVNVRGEFQQLEVAFDTMLGSKEKADKLMAEVVQLAATTPFTLQDVGAGAKQLLAYGTAAGDITKTLTMLGNVASGVGAPLNDIIYLYGTLQTQGRAYTRDIVQFSQRGIPIYDELAKVLGTSKDKINGLVEAGKVGFPEVQKAFENMTGSGGKFFNLMASQSRTLTGQLSNLSDAITRMLNDIGKSHQGLFADAISGATNLVNNYQKVLDILRLIGIAYGSYRAALLLTTVAERFRERLQVQLALAEDGVTAGAVRQATAIVILKTAWQSLLTTIASFAPVAVISAIGTAIYALTQTINNAKEVQRVYNDVIGEGNKAYLDEKEKIDDLEKTINSQTATREQQVEAVKQLREATGDTLKNYSDEEILAGRATIALNKYATAARNAATAKAAQAAIDDTRKSLVELEAKGVDAQPTFERLGESLKAFFGGGDFSKHGFWEQFFSTDAADKAFFDHKKDLYLREIEALQKILNPDLNPQHSFDLEARFGSAGTDPFLKHMQENGGGFSGLTPAQKRSVDVIDAEIKKLKEEQSQVSDNRKTWEEYAAKIKALEEERERITGKTTKELKAENSLLEERKNLLESIRDLQRDAKQSGLLKDQSEVDKLNEKYDNLITKVKDYNDKLAAYNKKNRTSVQGIGQVDINAINQARAIEVNNTILKQNAETYLKNLDKQKALFQQYEEAKKKIGIDAANEMFADQTKGFENYVAFLKGEIAKTAVPVSLFGSANIGDATKLKGLMAELKNAETDLFKQQQEILNQALLGSNTLGQKQLIVISNYEAQIKALEDKRTAENAAEIDKRVQILTNAKRSELEAVKVVAYKEAEIYKKLNTDIVNKSKADLKKLVASLRADLSSGVTKLTDGSIVALTPEMRKNVEDGIRTMLDYIESIDEAGTLSQKHLAKAAELAGKLSTTFHSLSDAIKPLNKGLAGSIGQIGDMLGLAQNALTTIVAIKKGMEALNQKDAAGNAAPDVEGAITNFASAAQGIAQAVQFFVSAIVEYKKSVTESKDAVAAFYAQVIVGEAETNRLMRERLAQQALLNKLKLDGLKAEKGQLEANKVASQQEFNDLLQKLQQEQFVSGEHRKFSFRGGPHYEVVQELQSLSGKSFDDLQKLFNSGQLTDKAKALFEQLQKLKDEGVDIDKQLADIQAQTAQIFTGTTSDAILDSIVQGFKNGKRAAVDFADDFQSLMQNAILNALKYQTLEGPLKDFYNQFNIDAQSDGVLTQAEIDQLHKNFDSIITNAQQRFEQLQKITSVNFSSSGSASGNNLITGFRTLSEETGQLLAGQFGGLRITALQQLELSRQVLDYNKRIESNTMRTADNTAVAAKILQGIESGLVKVTLR